MALRLPTSGARVRFALASLAVTVALAAAVYGAGWWLVASRIPDRDARAVSDLLTPAAASILSGIDPSQPLSPGTAQRLDQQFGPLIGDDGLRAVRLWSADGRLLYEIGASGEARPAPAAPSREALVEHRGDALVAFAPLGSVVLETSQAWGPTGAGLATARRLLLISAAAGGLALYLVVQVVFWAATGRFVRDHHRLTYLFRSGQRFAAALDVEGVLDNLCREVAAVTNAHYALVALIEDEATGDPVLRASYDRKHEMIAHHHRTLDEWMLRRSAVSREPMRTREPALPFRDALGHGCGDGPAWLLVVPLVLRDAATGVVAVVRDARDGAFDDKQVELVGDLAAQAAMCVEQATLFAKVRAYAGELEVGYDSTIKALMAALDAKDGDTEGHSERVRALTVAVARELGLPEERRPDLERGALLHDLGKIGVPDAILQKPASLSKREWEAMQRHPLLAALMVSDVGFLEGAVPILLYHHERYDGGGYPFGLRGEQIPVEARILSVIDAYDAMTSDRPYRSAISHEEAIAELRANAGTQFDPAVVDAFERVIGALREQEDRAA